jgi:hypothetical protein
MGRGDRNKVRWARDRKRKHKEREARKVAGSRTGRAARK